MGLRALFNQILSEGTLLVTTPRFEQHSFKGNQKGRSNVASVVYLGAGYIELVTVISSAFAHASNFVQNSPSRGSRRWHTVRRQCSGSHFSIPRPSP